LLIRTTENLFLQGVVLADIVAHVRLVETKIGTRFLIGDKSVLPQREGLLEVLAPAASDLWGSHLKLLLDLRSKTMASEDLTIEYLSGISARFQEAQSLLLSILPLCIIDYCFHLRKNLTKDLTWKLLRDSLNTERLKDFPRFRGMRLQVIAGLVAAVPKHDRANRLANVPRFFLPIPQKILLAACDILYSRGFLRPLKRIINEAQAIKGNSYRRNCWLEHEWGR